MATLQSAATSGNGTAVKMDGQLRGLTFYIEASGTITAGAVQIEEARAADWSGTWAAVGSPVTLATNTVAVVRSTASFNAVRARISTGLTGGGTVTVEVIGGNQ